MFAANAKLNLWLYGTPLFNANLYKLTYADLID